MNKTLFKVNFKNNWLTLLSFSIILLMYSTISVAMFDPLDASVMESMIEIMPEGMVKALGFQNFGTELTSYMSNYLYGFIFIVFPMIYTIIIANKLMAKLVDNGSMAYLLTTPNSRVKIAMTQAVFLVVSCFMIILVNVIVVIIMSETILKGHLQISRYLELNLVTFLTITFVSSTSFFFSCLFDDAKNSFLFGAGIPVLFFVFKMLSNISESIDFLNNFTVYTLIDIDRILSDFSYVIVVSLLLVISSIIVFFSGIYVFNKRSLSI